jgi:AcrR family transcriptional regulator
MELHQNSEEKILAAAKKIFIREGMAGARMQDIADEAGINKALLHYYFKNKEQLFERVLKEAIGRFIPRVKELLLSDVSVYEKIELFCHEYISMAMENPYIPLFVLSEVNRQPEVFISKMFSGGLPDFSVFVRQLDEEIEAGRMRKISPVQLLMNMMGMCVFPFVGKPILQALMGLDELQFRMVMEQRKQQVASFVLNSIRT